MNGQTPILGQQDRLGAGDPLLDLGDLLDLLGARHPVSVLALSKPKRKRPRRSGGVRRAHPSVPRQVPAWPDHAAPLLSAAPSGYQRRADRTRLPGPRGHGTEWTSDSLWETSSGDTAISSGSASLAALRSNVHNDATATP